MAGSEIFVQAGLLSIALLFFLPAILLFTNIMNHHSIIVILSAEEMQQVISSDADHYYDKFHKVDYKVRNVKNKKNYLEKISQSGCTGEEECVKKINVCIELIHSQLATKRNQTIHGIHIETFLNIPWRIGFTCDTNYENGLPHTRGDVIILNNRDIQTRTITEVCKLLIHEKSHVYQKSQMKEMTAYLKTNYTEVKQKDYTDESIPANPDTNDYIYRCNKTNVVLGGKYEKNPTHFRDISFTGNDHTLEHPYESIAYKMEDLFRSNY